MVSTMTSTQDQETLGKGRWQLPSSVSALLDDELRPDEKLVWLDQPDAGHAVRKSLLIYFFAVPWTAFSLFWMAGAAGFEIPDFTKANHFFALFGLPFVLIGLGMLSAPFYANYASRRSLYALTDQRAIIFDGGRSTTIKSVPVIEFHSMYRKQRPDGSGDLILCEKFQRDSDGDTVSTKQTFESIAQVKMVEDLARKLSGGPK